MESSGNEPQGMKLSAAPVPIEWHFGLPIYASEAFLRVDGGRFGWIGGIDDKARVVRLLSRLGLPTEVDRYLDERTLSFMGADKKRKAGKLHFIVPGAPGQTEIIPLAEDEVKRLVSP